MGVPEKALYEDNEKFFKDLETALKPYNLHLGYRAAKEILDALALAGKDKDTTLDRQLCNKVLPRIRGPRASVEGPLIALLGVIGDTDGGKPWDEQGVHHHLQAKKPDSSGGAWPTSRKKIWQMLRRAHEIGFTSYFG